jgi:hypothetical protein
MMQSGPTSLKKKEKKRKEKLKTLRPWPQEIENAIPFS